MTDASPARARARRANLVHEAELPATALPGGPLSTRVAYDAASGCEHLVQELLEVAPGGSAACTAGDCDQVLFVLGGSGVLQLAGVTHALEAESGATIRPGEQYTLENPGAVPLTVHSVTLPLPPSDGETSQRQVVTRLADQEARAATGARQFRIVTDPAIGCPSATQFIGYIPPGRAPDHFHTYDEVIYVLDGQGLLHIGALHEPIGRGSCIHLTPRLVHSLENTGDSTMQVLGIFRPAGSPAEAYYPDGTLAYDYRNAE